jgi:hypothetical protein
MKGKSEDEQCVGPCFVELADQMKNVYGQYCMNHNNALILLEKVSSYTFFRMLCNFSQDTRQVRSAVTYLTCIQEISSSYISWGTDCPDKLSILWYFSSP